MNRCIDGESPSIDALDEHSQVIREASVVKFSICRDGESDASGACIV